MQTIKQKYYLQTMKEIWKIFSNKRVLYEVSNYGRVKRNGKLYKPNESKNGYYRVGFCLVHRLVAEYFIPNPENKPCVDHIDTDKHNNRADNLRWCTYSENLQNPITKSRRIGQNHKMSDYWYKINKESHQNINKADKNPAFGHKWMNKDGDIVYPKIEDVHIYLELGYKFGRK